MPADLLATSCSIATAPPTQPDLHAQLTVGDAPEQLDSLDEVALPGAVGPDEHGDRAQGRLDVVDRLVAADGDAPDPA